MSTRRTTAERIEAELKRKKETQEEIKRLMQQQRKEERKARTRRLTIRGGMLESLLPDTISLNDERFTDFLKRTTANDYGRRALADFSAEQAKENAANSTDTDKPEDKTDTAQGGEQRDAAPNVRTAGTGETPAAKPAQTAAASNGTDGSKTGVTAGTGG